MLGLTHEERRFLSEADYTDETGAITETLLARGLLKFEGRTDDFEYWGPNAAGKLALKLDALARESA